MMYRQVLHLRSLILFIMAGFLAAGCAILQPQEPPAFDALIKVRDALDAARENSMSEKCPDEYGAFYTSYLEARGTLYACNDAQALATANELFPQVQDLVQNGCNKPPTCRLLAPSEGSVNEPIAFRVDASDPDGDPLTFDWSFGDGTTLRDSGMEVMHTYTEVGLNRVRMVCSDGRGGTDEDARDIQIVSIKVISSEVLFDFDKSDIKPEGEDVLAGIVQELQDNPAFEVRVVGHTDSVGPEEWNWGLSERRAKAVRDYLISSGIDSIRITTDWRGETEPVASNETQEGRAKNRRAEITVSPPGRLQ